MPALTTMHAEESHPLPADSGAKPGLRVLGAVLLAAALAAVFHRPLGAAFSQARSEDLHSHLLLVPFVSAYLLYTGRAHLAAPSGASLSGTLLFAAAACVLPWLPAQDPGNLLALRIAAFVAGLAAACFFCLGGAWVRSAAFPLAFLLFLVPLPPPLIAAAEAWLVAGSAAIAALLFELSGTPLFREGQVLQLPGISLEVARECSGIRSTLVLFITGLVASRLILRSPWRRAVLVAAVIPLGILRNALRIWVIGLLCVHGGSHWIDSWLHRQGGPLFFALSLLPLFLLAWWLRRGESSHPLLEKTRPPCCGMLSNMTRPGPGGA